MQAIEKAALAGWKHGPSVYVIAVLLLTAINRVLPFFNFVALRFVFFWAIGLISLTFWKKKISTVFLTRMLLYKNGYMKLHIFELR